MIRTIGRLSVLLSAVFLLGAAAMAVPSAAPGQPVAGEQHHLAKMLVRKVFIRGGCPHDLDRECDRLPDGRLVHCRCVS